MLLKPVGTWAPSTLGAGHLVLLQPVDTKASPLSIEARDQMIYAVTDVHNLLLNDGQSAIDPLKLTFGLLVELCVRHLRLHLLRLDT